MTGHPQSPSRVEQDLIALAAKYDKLASGYEKVTAPPQETIAEYRLIASALRAAATQADREMARAQLRRFHRSSCYPDAMDIEVDLALDAILAALSLPASASEWRDIASVPKDGTRCILAFHSNVVTVGNWLDNSKKSWPWMGWSTMQGPFNPQSLVGWMPLPAPPIAANSRGGADNA